MFLEDFCRHWPRGEDYTYVDFVRDGVCGDAPARSGSKRWRRLTEVRSGAKSLFQFERKGSVAKSTHAGLPWLLYLRRHLPHRVHFWPFEGWDIPAGRSVIAEVHPALWSRSFPREDRDPAQHEAYSIAAWMRHAGETNSLTPCFHPDLEESDRKVAEIEGWMLGA